MHRLLLLSILLAALGCGPSGPVTHKVTGKVTYKNAPVGAAQISFIPNDASGAVKPANGQTDAQGNYTVTTYVSPEQQASGAMAGSFKVTVAKGPPPDKVLSYEELAAFKSEIPTTYADTTKTKLSAEVTAGGKNEFDFALED